jgi:aldehyde:ferredoxin oxidoreductase
MLTSFYKMRGFDKNGIPTEKTLKKLGIDMK